jgi:hypothetical protein
MDTNTTTAIAAATQALLDYATGVAFEHCLSVVADGVNVGQLTRLRFVGACDKLEALGVPQTIGLEAASKGYRQFQELQAEIASGDQFLDSLG